MSNTSKGYYAACPNWQSFVITGPDAKDFLHRITTANLKFLKPGQSTPVCLLQNTGKIITYFHLHCDSEGNYSCWTPAGSATAIEALEKLHFRENLKMTAVENGLRFFSVWEKEPTEVAVQWKNSFVIARDFSTSVYSNFASDFVEDAEHVEFLRVKTGVPAWPTEINTGLIPLEAKMDSAVHENKGCYPGQEVIERIRSIGAPSRLLCLLQKVPGTAAEPGFKIGDPITIGGASVGEVTSLARYNQDWAAMGFVRRTAIGKDGAKMGSVNGTAVQIEEKK